MTSESQMDAGEVPKIQSILGWTTLIVVLLSALALGANRPVSWSLLSMFLLPMFLAQIICDLITGVQRNSYRVWLPVTIYIGVLFWAYYQTLPVTDPGLAHPAWSLVPDVTGHISADPIKSHHHIMRLAAYGMIFWIMVRATTNVDRGLHFLKVIAIWCAMLAVFGLGAIATGQNFILGEDAGDVVSASFFNRNSYATYAVFGSVANLAIYLHLQRGSSNRFGPDNSRQILREFIERFFTGSWIFAVGFLLCFASLLATQSRAGSVAGILAVLTLFSVYRQKSDDSRNYSWMIAAGVFVVVLILLSAGVASRIMATSEESLRFIIYPIVWDGIFDRPVLGNGLGAFHTVFRTAVPLTAAGAEWELAHNSYLENAFELGIPAAAAFYLSLLMLTGIVIWGCYIRRNHRIFACVALACIVGAAFHALFDFSLQMPAVAGLFAVVLGIGCSNSWPRQPKKTKR